MKKGDAGKSISNYDSQVDVGKRIFLQYDQQTMIQKYQLASDEKWIYLTYLNIPFRISLKTGGIEECIQNRWSECRSYNTVMTIYDLLCYHQGAAAPIMRSQWCSIGTFVVTGGGDTGTFTNRYAAFFSEKLDKLRCACEMLGGELQPRMAGADVTCRFPVTGFFHVLLQFWEGDEDFPPKLMLMWDRNTDQFLHFETTFFLQGDLLARLKEYMQ